MPHCSAQKSGKVGEDTVLPIFTQIYNLCFPYRIGIRVTHVLKSSTCSIHLFSNPTDISGLPSECQALGWIQIIRLNKVINKLA